MILVLIPVTFELLFVAVLGFMLFSAAQDFDRLEHSSNALINMGEFEISYSRALFQMNMRNYNYKQRVQAVYELLSKLDPARYMGGLDPTMYPELKPVFDQARDLQEQYRAVLDRWHQDYRYTLHPEEAVRLFEETMGLHKESTDIERHMAAAQPRELDAFRWHIGELIAGAIVFSTVISIGLAELFSADVVKRLRLIGHNAQRIARGEKLPRMQYGSDELAQLDRVLHESSLILTEARRKELAILDNAADVICSLDAKLRFQAVGAATTKVWLSSPQDLLGRSMLALLATATVEQTRQVFQRIAEEGHEGEVENLVRCGDGSFKNSLWKINWSAQERSYYCVVHDVTELRSLESLKRHFIAMVSHDLRTPLSSVGVGLSLLLSGKRGEISPEVRKLLHMAQSNMNRLMDLVNELLELEKLESGKLMLDLTCVSIADVCSAAKEAVERVSSAKNVRIKGPFGDKLVHADQKRFLQVVTNLLANAIKSAPRDSTINLSIVRRAEQLELRVADEGAGIHSQQRMVIFDKYQQSLAAPTVPLQGSGLGLAIVKAIVEAHSGQVGVDSGLGKGSVFWVRMPEYVDDEEDVP